MVASAVLDLRLIETLGLSLAAMAVVSTAIFAFSAERRVRVVVESQHVRVFKDEEASVVVGFELAGGEWTGLRLASCGFANAKVLRTEALPGHRFRLGVDGRFAGRAEGLRVRLSLTDPLGIFEVPSEAVCEGLILDVLPRSLLAVAVPAAAPNFGMGERPAGYPGPGQELYGLEYYHPSSDAKDIVWKRAARSPEERLVQRVRESNVRESVRVGVVRTVDRGEGRFEWNDKLCEALASLGKDLLEMGVRMEVLYTKGGSLAAEKVSDKGQLADAVMACSAASASAEVSELVAESDLIITGTEELEDGGVADAVSSMPLLLIGDEERLGVVARTWTVYSGEESLRPLLRRVMET